MSQEPPQGFFARMRNALAKAMQDLGMALGGKEETPSPEPQDVEDYPEYEEPEPQDIEPPQYLGGEPNYESRCVTGYLQGYASGRRIRVKSRWYADNPDIECIRVILDNTLGRLLVTVIVCGTPSEEYPGKEGEDTICLGYRLFRSDVVQYAYGSGTALDFVNSVHSTNPEVNFEKWTDLESVSFLDVP